MRNAKRTVALLLGILLLFTLLPCAPRAGATNVYNIALNAETAVTLSAPEERVYFRFTPEETATYRFFSDAQIDVYAVLRDAEMNTVAENDDGGPGHNFRIDAALTAGETCYFEVFCVNGSTGSFAVKLVKMTDAAFTLRAKNGKTSLRAAPGESVTLETQAYSAMGKTLRYAWYQVREGTDDALLPETSAALTVENVTDTARYTCRAQDEYGSYGEVRFTLYCFAEQTLALNAAAAAEIAVPNTRAYFAFTPEETATYRFFSQTDVDVYAAMLDAELNTVAENDDGGPGHNFRIDAALTAGETYYFEVFCVNGSTGSFPVRLVKPEPNGFSAKPKDGLYNRRVSPGETVTLEVEATPGMGPVSFRWFWMPLSGDAEALPETGETLTLENVTASERYLCRVTDDFGFFEDVDFRVYCFTAQPLALNEETAVNITLPGEWAWFSFTPEVTRVYRFYSRTDGDVMAELYNADMELVDYNDDGGPGRNFMLKTELTAGETCYFAVFYCNGAAGSFPVYLVLPEENGFSAARATDEFVFLHAGDEPPTMKVTAACLEGELHFRWRDQTLSGWIDGAADAAFTPPAFTKGAVYVCCVNDDFGNTAEIPFELVNLDAITYEWTQDRAYCTATYEDVSPAKVEIVPAAAETTATCEKEGVTVYTAAFADPRFAAQTLTEDTVPLGHDYGAPVYEWSEDNVYCTAKVICARDESHVLSETAKAKITKVLTEPGCTEPGWGVFTVGFNSKRFYGQQKEGALPALGHDLIYHEAQAPTCSAVGWEAYQTCSRCKYTTYKELPRDPDAHDFNVTVYPPDCVNPGYTSHACKYCRYGYSTDETEPLGHDYGAPVYLWSEDNGACTAMVICARDPNHVIAETAKSEILKEECTEPTCTQPGKTVYTAGFINKRFFGQRKEAEIPATGHDWGDWTVIKEPAPGVPGEERRECKNDPSHVETRALPALPDAYLRGDVDNSGDVTAADARLALRAAVGLEPEWDKNPDDPRWRAADADGEGGITAADARLILRAAVHLETL